MNEVWEVGYIEAGSMMLSPVLLKTPDPQTGRAVVVLQLAIVDPLGAAAEADCNNQKHPAGTPGALLVMVRLVPAEADETRPYVKLVTGGALS